MYERKFGSDKIDPDSYHRSSDRTIYFLRDPYPNWIDFFKLGTV